MANPCPQCQSMVHCQSATELHQAYLDAYALLRQARRAFAEHVTGQPHGETTNTEERWDQ